MGTTTAATPDPADREGRTDPPPFGLPVLAEVPELTALLELAVEAERTTARLIEQLLVLSETGLTEAATGVPLEQWLAVVARSTRSDRRMLMTAVGVCRRLPSLRAGFGAGEVSWSQLRAVALKLERVPRLLDDRLDGALASAIDGAAGADPDALARVVTWTLAELGDDDATAAAGAPNEDLLVLQPRLDGSGGRLYGDLGPVGFAAVDAATDPGPLGTATRTSFGAAPDADGTAENRRTVGQARAARLIDLCRRGGPDDPRRDAGEAGGARPVRPPTLLLRAELDALLGRSGPPAQLLTTLAGGVMHCDTATARRLVDEHGADLRLVVLDDGAVVGVGRRTRQPPGWLTDAALALHDTCTEPGACPTAARVCDLDHARPTAAAGPTDVANLAPLCASANHRKERDGWTATQTADGTRTWRHARSGLTTRTLPATWRPPDRRGDRGPPGDPPLAADSPPPF